MNSTLTRPVVDPHNPIPEFSPTNPLIEGVEKLEDWLAHREIVVPELCPVGALETLYAQRAALYLWRIDRVIRCEIDVKFGAIEAGSTATCEDPANAQDRHVSRDQSTLQTIIKYEAHLLRCLAGTMAELRRLQKERRQGLRDANPGGRGADRAGICENGALKTGSPGGSPSQTGSPSRPITSPEMLIPGGRGADRAGVCEKEFVEKGSHGGSPSQKSPRSHTGSPPQKHSHSRKNSTRRSESRSRRASPAPKIPPLLDAISRRRRLCESIAGETFEFERNLTTATLDFSVGRCP